MEGFRVKLVNDEDMFVWEVALFGPPDTLYQGGYFKVRYEDILFMEFETRVQNLKELYLIYSFGRNFLLLSMDEGGGDILL